MKIVSGLHPYRFDNKILILAIDQNWMQIFGDLSFDVTISGGHLRIQSTQKIQ